MPYVEDYNGNHIIDVMEIKSFFQYLMRLTIHQLIFIVK